MGAMKSRWFTRPKWLAMLGLASLATLLLALRAHFASGAEPELLMRFRSLSPVNVKPPIPHLEAEPLTAALRKRGYHECNPHDPIGLGPYDPYRNVRVRGRMLIPQKGGHTDDMGFDVIVHFHGHEPVRKTLVQVARGVSFVGIDLGINSGPYSKAFEVPGTYHALIESIEHALQEKTGQENAYIRNLALTAWSAGYGAINEILKQRGDEGIDAIALLDGLHAGWDPTSSPSQSRKTRPLSGANIAPILDFAEAAKRGEKVFVFTHSQVDPVDYPSTKRTADFILETLSLAREKPKLPNLSLPFPALGRADYQGFHVWSYSGGDTKAHCEHIRFIAPIVRDILEPRWDTPLMDRNVPFNKAPKLGRANDAPKRRRAVEAPG